jgi:hypothetical protein
MQNGELIVTGKDEAKIHLNDKPARVECRFIDDDISVPCNPNHFDALEYEVHSHDGFFTMTYHLVIRWSVQNTREIAWAVYY